MHCGMVDDYLFVQNFSQPGRFAGLEEDYGSPDEIEPEEPQNEVEEVAMEEVPAEAAEGKVPAEAVEGKVPAKERVLEKEKAVADSNFCCICD